jgi:virulence-associated protein VapD
MQIQMDVPKINRERRYNAHKMQHSIDKFMVDKLGLQKASGGFYLGSGNGKDFSMFGIAFNTLRKKDWFTDNVKTWLYFNSDASDDPSDFAIEDFKAFCDERKALA